MTDWLISDFTALIGVAVSVFIVVFALIFLNRMFGLRSFSKLSGFDFAITVAFGSIVASTVVTQDPPVLQAIGALLCLFGLQATIAIARRRFGWASRLINNEPRLVWRDGEFLTDQMRRAQITRSDVIAKMREANAIRMQDVLAVVVETTGDVSVLHKTGDDKTIDATIMEGVIGWSGENG